MGLAKAALWTSLANMRQGFEEKRVCEQERKREKMREGDNIRRLERRRRLSEEVPTVSL